METFIKVQDIKSCSIEYKEYDGYNKCISVTMWHNGEGYDIGIDEKTFFSIEHDEWEKIQLAILALNNDVKVKQGSKTSDNIQSIDVFTSVSQNNNYNDNDNDNDEIPFWTILKNKTFNVLCKLQGEKCHIKTTQI